MCLCHLRAWVNECDTVIGISASSWFAVNVHHSHTLVFQDGKVLKCVSQVTEAHFTSDGNVVWLLTAATGTSYGHSRSSEWQVPFNGNGYYRLTSWHTLHTLTHTTYSVCSHAAPASCQSYHHLLGTCTTSTRDADEAQKARQHCSSGYISFTMYELRMKVKTFLKGVKYNLEGKASRLNLQTLAPRLESLPCHTLVMGTWAAFLTCAWSSLPLQWSLRHYYRVPKYSACWLSALHTVGTQ